MVPEAHEPSDLHENTQRLRLCEAHLIEPGLEVERVGGQKESSDGSAFVVGPQVGVAEEGVEDRAGGGRSSEQSAERASLRWTEGSPGRYRGREEPKGCD